MDEKPTPQDPQAEATEPQTDEVKPTRLQSFVNKHPRAAKVVAITGAVTAALGAVQIARTAQANRHHAIAAGDHAQESLRELSATVTPQETTEA